MVRVVRFYGRTVWAAIAFFILADLLVQAQVVSAHLGSHGAGWAISETSLLLTRDEGTTWRDVTPNHSLNEHISDASFSDALHGHLSFLKDASSSEVDMEDDVLIYNTDNGGVTWTTVSIPNQTISRSKACCFAASLTFVDDSNGWLMARLPTGANFSIGALFHTEDGGKNWIKLSDPPTGDKPYFVSTAEGWLAGGAAGMDLWKTVDSGATWQSVSIPALSQSCSLGCRPGYEKPMFTDSLHGFLTVTLTRAESEQVIYLVTSDGGKSWQHDSNSASFQQPAKSIIAIRTPSGPAQVSLTPDGTVRTSAYGIQKQTKLDIELTNSSDVKLKDAGFISNSEGWLLVSVRTCQSAYTGVPNVCPTKVSLHLTQDGGKSYHDVSPPTPTATSRTYSPESSVTSDMQVSPPVPYRLPPPPRPPPPTTPPPVAHPVITGNQVSIADQGFDVACAPSSALMGTWWNFSPFFDVGIYLGGAHVSCPLSKDPNLSVAWTQSTANSGWGLIPIWVGLQAPLVCGPPQGMTANLISSASASTSYAQGVSDAQGALAAGTTLDIGGIVYTDIEGYGVSPCPSVQSYLEGWGNTPLSRP